MNCKYCKTNCTGAKQDREVAMCLGYDPLKTNADRIRNMTDEEIFDLFTEVMGGERFFYCPACREKTESECFASNCANCFMEWLKQEVNDG